MHFSLFSFCFYLCFSFSHSDLLGNHNIIRLQPKDEKKGFETTLTGLQERLVTLNGLDLCLCGAFATVIGDFVMHPVDTIKVTQQASSTSISILQAVAKIMAQGGLGAFFQGVVPYLIGDGSAGAVKFATFEVSQRFVEKRVPEKYHPFTKFLCAAFAYIMCSFLLVPGEVIKCGLQAGVSSSFLGFVSKTFAEEGLGGFFVGYGATLLRDVPYTMLELGLYENIKTLIGTVQKRSSVSQNEELLAAAITGGFTSYVTTPLDTIKTKLMTQTLEGATQYKGIVDACGRIYAAEGMKGLFAGSLARVAWLLPFTTIYLGLYEVAKRKALEIKQSAIV